MASKTHVKGEGGMGYSHLREGGSGGGGAVRKYCNLY